VCQDTGVRNLLSTNQMSNLSTLMYGPVADSYFRIIDELYENGQIETEFKFIDTLFLKNTAEYITDKKSDIIICKTEFKMAGTKVSISFNPNLDFLHRL